MAAALNFDLAAAVFNAAGASDFDWVVLDVDAAELDVVPEEEVDVPEVDVPLATDVLWDEWMSRIAATMPTAITHTTTPARTSRRLRSPGS